MKKILSLLFSIVFLLVLVSYFSPKSFAVCTPINTCSAPYTCPSGSVKATSQCGWTNNDSANGDPCYSCVQQGTTSSNCPTGTYLSCPVGSTSTLSRPAGSYGAACYYCSPTQPTLNWPAPFCSGAASEMVLSWKPVGDASYYYVRYRPNGDSSKDVVTKTYSLSVDVTGQAAGTSIQWWVQACDSSNRCSPSPAGPTTSLGTCTVTNPLKTDTCTPAGGNCSSPTATSCAGAFPGSVLDATKTCPVSGQMCCVGSSSTPGAPSLVSGTCTGTTATLNWTNGANTPTANAYYCDQTKAKNNTCIPDNPSADPSQYFLLISGGNNKSPLSVTGLTAGDTYRWMVAGYNNSLHTNSSIGTFACTAPVTCADQAPTACVQTPGYCDGRGSQTITNKCSNGTSSQRTVSCSTASKTCDTNYSCTNGTTCTLNSTPKPTAPTINGTAACVSASSYTVNWTKGDNTTETVLYYCDKTKAASKNVSCTKDKAITNDGSLAGWYIAAGNAAATSPQTLTGLTTGDQYTWFVRAYNGVRTNANTPFTDSGDGNFTAAACPATCTAPQINPHFECQNNTCVSVAACAANSGGCTSAGGTCGTQAGDTTLKFVVGLDGIGSTGDNVSPVSSGSNKNPLTTTRNMDVKILNSQNQQIAEDSSSMTYNQATGKFNGTAVYHAFQTGNYSVKVTSDGHLVRLVPGIQTITANTINTMPNINLVAGDVDNNNALNIKDYNILMSCLSANDPGINGSDGGTLCHQNANYAARSDLDDNGTIDLLNDYNLFLREYSVQNGD